MTQANTQKTTPRLRCGAEVSNRYTYGWHGCRNPATWRAMVKCAAGVVPSQLCKRHMDAVAKDRIVSGPTAMTLRVARAALAAAEGKAE